MISLRFHRKTSVCLRFDGTVHIGNWHVQIRRKGLYTSKTFRIKADAQRWAASQEDRLDRGEGVSKQTKAVETIADLIDLHMEDTAEVGKAAQRSKEYTLTRLKETISDLKTSALTREYIMEFGHKRAEEGAINTGYDAMALLADRPRARVPRFTQLSIGRWPPTRARIILTPWHARPKSPSRCSPCWQR